MRPTDTYLPERKSQTGRNQGTNHPFYGKHHSEETKAKLRTANLGRHLSEEHKQKISESMKKVDVTWNIGRKHPESVREKQRIAIKGRRLSQSTRDKIGKSARGRSRSPEYRAKISKSLKGRFCGDKNPNWKGGICSDPGYFMSVHLKRRTNEINGGDIFTWQEWELLKKQYDFTCPRCKRREPEIKLTADHVIPLSKGGSNKIENIQPLCGSCNSTKNVKIFRLKPNGELVMF